MGIKDLAGFSDPLTKLIEVIAAGCGMVTRSYFTRQAADDKAYEMKLLAQTEYEIKQLISGSQDTGKVQLLGSAEIVNTNPLLPERALSRSEYREAVRQQNLESICTVAAEDLAHESEVPEQKPEPEWINRFFNVAEEISSEELQLLWGKILAGEIKRPGSFSLRTLETLRNVSKEEAEAFNRLSPYIAVTSRGARVPPIDIFKYGGIATKARVQLQMRLRYLGDLVDAGLILSKQADVSYVQPFHKNEHDYIRFGKVALVVFNISDKPRFLQSKTKYYSLTKAGSELLRLISNSDEPDVEYIRFFAQDVWSPSFAFFLAPINDRTGLPNLDEKTPLEVSPPEEDESPST